MAAEAPSVLTAPARAVERPTALYYEILDFQADSLELLRAHFDVVSLPDPTHDTAGVLGRARVIFAPMGFLFDRAKIDRCPKLVAIGSPTTGVPHIDAEYAATKGIAVCSLRDQQAFLSTITPTAELAWGMILAVTRRIPWAHESVCAGRWECRHFGQRTPRMLSAMTLGVVGLGRLGSLVAGYGRAFGMPVFYYDPYRGDDRYSRCDSVASLAKASDIVSVHVHATAEAENLIDRTFLEAMPPGSYLVNTARGDVLDEAALLDALDSGHLGGAALDTLRGEHLPGFKERLDEHPLLRYARAHDNLVLTPHYGGSTRDAWERTEARIIELLARAVRAKGIL